MLKNNISLVLWKHFYLNVFDPYMGAIRPAQDMRRFGRICRPYPAGVLSTKVLRSRPEMSKVQPKADTKSNF